MQARAAAYQRAGHGAGVQVATDRRRRGTGSATKRVVQRDHAGHADGRRVDGSASGVFVEVDVGGRSSSDRQTTGNDGRIFISRGYVIGHRAGMTAGVGHHRNGSTVVHIVVRFERHAAAIGIVNNVAERINTIARLVCAGAGDVHIAQHACSRLSRCQRQHRDGADHHRVVVTAGQPGTGFVHALGRNAAGEPHRIEGVADTTDVHNAIGRRHGGATINTMARPRNTL